MLYFIKIAVESKDLSLDGLWDLWEKETEAAAGAMAAGKIKHLYKIAGQRRVVGVVDMESHDELDQVLMAGLPMSDHIIVEELLPIRPYEDFAKDVKRRWKPAEGT